MKKFLAVAFSFFLLGGCFGSDNIVDSEYELKQDNELFRIVIGFNNDGRFYSNAINGVTAAYPLNNDSITLSINSKTNVVPHQDYVAIENTYFSDLRKVNKFRTTPSSLSLYTYDGKTLQFDRVGKAQVQ